MLPKTMAPRFADDIRNLIKIGGMDARRLKLLNSDFDSSIASAVSKPVLAVHRLNIDLQQTAADEKVEEKEEEKSTHRNPLRNITVKKGLFGEIKYIRLPADAKSKYVATERSAKEKVGNLSNTRVASCAPKTRGSTGRKRDSMNSPKRAKLSVGFASAEGESTPFNVKIPPQSLSPIEQLPRELAYSVFDYVHEHLKYLRATSSALLTRVNEFALQQVTTQLVDELHLETENERAHRLFATLVLPKNKAHLFELRYQLRRGSIAKSRVKRYEHKQITRYKFVVRKREYKLWECISATIGIRIDRVSILSCFERQTFNRMSDLLGVFKFDILKVESFSYSKENCCATGIVCDVADAILKMVETKRINHLLMSLFFSEEMPLEEYLYKLSSLVRSLHFDPRRAFIGYFTVMPRLILGMLSQKLDKLIIVESLWYFSAFSPKTINILAEQIPLLGKEIWFQATCRDNIAVNTSSDTYHIEVVQWDKRLTHRVTPADYVDIKHRSRAHEPIMERLSWLSDFIGLQYSLK